MRKLAIVLALAVLGGCSLFGWIGDDSFERVFLWRLPAIVSSGLVDADDNSVYVMGSDRRLYALDRASGASRWATPSGQVGFTAGVARVGSMAVTAGGSLVAFDAITGEARWTNTMSDRLGEFFFAHGDSVIFPSTFSSPLGSVYALSADNRVLWQTSIIPPDSTIGAEDRVRAFPPEYRDGVLVYSYVWWRGGGQPPPKGGIAAVDANTGRLRWSRLVPVASADANSFPSDAVTDGVGAFLTVRDGRVFGYAVADGTLLWTAGPVTPASEPTATDIRPLTVTDRTVVVGSGRSVLTGYDAATGQTRWHVSSENGGVAKLYRFGNTATISLHYDGGLTLRDSKDGRRTWFADPSQGKGGVNSVAVFGDTVFAASVSGGLQAFRLLRN